MHALKVSLLLVPIVVAIAGCSALNTPTPPTEPQQAQSPELLYVGTSNPGLLTYQIRPDGALQAKATSTSVPTVCSPSLEPVPGRVYVISLSCTELTGPLEFRRFDLDPAGNIASATGLLTLGPDFPSVTDAVSSFLTGSTGKFAYTWSVGNDFQEHISVVQIGAAGDLTVKPGLGLSSPLEVSAFCGEVHSPDSVVTTQEGTFLIVLDRRSCRDIDPTVNYPVYQVDSETGAIVTKVGTAAIGDITSPTPFTTQNGALMIFGELPDTGENGDLRLFHIGLDGVTLLQQCLADQPACAHPESGVFHPSGKWVFIVDHVAGGIWTIPVTGSSLSADKASFLPVHLEASFQFAFSANGRSFYMGQWNDPIQTGEIRGFHVDESTGALTPIAGSPWPLGKIDWITTMTPIAGTGQ